MSDTPVVPTHVYSYPDAFSLFLADDIKLDFPEDRLNLGMFLQLTKLPVVDSRIDADGNLQLKVHAGEGVKDWPAEMWLTPGSHCWYTSKEATAAMLERCVSDVSNSMKRNLLDMLDALDKNECLLDDAVKEDNLSYEMTTGEYLTRHVSALLPILGYSVSHALNLLIQYRRLRKEML